jgi:hypothetical protein
MMDLNTRIRQTIGDLVVQLAMAHTEIEELKSKLSNADQNDIKTNRPPPSDGRELGKRPQ